MIAPVLFSMFKGRYWCGNFCPRGNFYDKIMYKISRKKKIPPFLKNKYFRAFMVFFIFTMFTIQMHSAWGDWNAIGRVFWNIIFVTTVVGITLSISYSPRAWCSFCPMGSLSALVAPKEIIPKQNKGMFDFKNIHVDNSCILCKKCEKVCPMQIKVYEAKGSDEGLMDTDCLKCGICIDKCPKKSIKMH